MDKWKILLISVTDYKKTDHRSSIPGEDGPLAPVHVMFELSMVVFAKPIEMSRWQAVRDLMVLLREGETGNACVKAAKM